jgi:hypothetical protein
MNKTFKHSLILSVLMPLLVFVGILFGLSFALAEGVDNITYPVAELGNCNNKSECKVFCGDPQNRTVCIDFAEKNKLMSKTKAKKARVVTQLENIDGPGGCHSESECREYCDDINHLDECMSFAEKNGMVEEKELKEMKQVAEALTQGAKLPGGCKNKKACEEYCDNEDNADECMSFAQEAGLMTPKEQEMIKKTGGKGPGGCRGKKQCDEYCDNPDNMEECMNFAIEHDIAPEQERGQMQQVLQAIKKGAKPPKCRGQKECDAFCQKPENREQCFEFAVAAGFVPQEEVEQMKQMMEKGITTGPGGCQKKEECDDFCQKPENKDECIEFSHKAGFMDDQQYDQAKKFQEKGLNSGPGGCNDREECDVYCQEHTDECLEFSVKAGFMNEDESRRFKDQPRQDFRQAGPGGCKTPEECDAFCSDSNNMEECQKFSENNNSRRERGSLDQMQERQKPEMMKEVQECAGDEECLKKFFNQERRSPEEMKEFQEKMMNQEDFNPERMREEFPRDGNMPNDDVNRMMPREGLGENKKFKTREEFEKENKERTNEMMQERTKREEIGNFEDRMNIDNQGLEKKMIERKDFDQKNKEMMNMQDINQEEMRKQFEQIPNKPEMMNRDDMQKPEFKDEFQKRQEMMNNNRSENMRFEDMPRETRPSMPDQNNFNPEMNRQQPPQGGGGFQGGMTQGEFNRADGQNFQPNPEMMNNRFQDNNSFQQQNNIPPAQPVQPEQNSQPADNLQSALFQRISLNKKNATKNNKPYSGVILAKNRSNSIVCGMFSKLKSCN